MTPVDPITAAPAPAPAPALGPAHARRLRALWRSAGWPCRDVVEAELLVAGMVERVHDAGGRESLQLTPAGVALIACAAQRHRGARGRHEALVAQVAAAMQRAGRIVWRGLSVRTAPLGAEAPARWVVARPDVFSIRHTTREDLVEPVVHEIKVSRADLLGDLRREAKRGAYRALSSQCWYVLAPGIGDADEIPPDCGVMTADGDRLEVRRPAPRRAMTLPLSTWMALARAVPEPPLDDDAQPML